MHQIQIEVGLQCVLERQDPQEGDAAGADACEEIGNQAHFDVEQSSLVPLHDAAAGREQLARGVFGKIGHHVIYLRVSQGNICIEDAADHQEDAHDQEADCGLQAVIQERAQERRGKTKQFKDQREGFHRNNPVRMGMESDKGIGGVVRMIAGQIQFISTEKKN